MLIQFTEGARIDVLEAAEYYRGVKNRHGLTFADELESSLERITEGPARHPMFGPRYRRLKMRRFPFGILYVVEESQIVVTAVMHLRRSPDAWLGRTKD